MTPATRERLTKLESHYKELADDCAHKAYWVRNYGLGPLEARERAAGIQEDLWAVANGYAEALAEVLAAETP